MDDKKNVTVFLHQIENVKIKVEKRYDEKCSVAMAIIRPTHRATGVPSWGRVLLLLYLYIQVLGIYPVGGWSYPHLTPLHPTPPQWLWYFDVKYNWRQIWWHCNSWCYLTSMMLRECWRRSKIIKSDHFPFFYTMVKRCCIHGCIRKKDDIVSVYRFPGKDDGRERERWLEAIPISLRKSEITDDSVVCSRHWPEGAKTVK